MSGMDLTVFEEEYLTRVLVKRREETDCCDGSSYLCYLQKYPAELRQLSKSIFNCYSIFFRDPLVYAILESQILPSIVMQKENLGQSTLRIWSAGCAAGQEPYSLAILLQELSQTKRIQYQIIATDACEDLLVKARDAIYDSSNLENVPLKWINKYFNPMSINTLEGNTSYQATSQLRLNVQFSTFDLNNPHQTRPPASIYGDFDLVMCSNLLFYYKPEVRSKIISKLMENMADNGILITGEAEKGIVSGTRGLKQLSQITPIFVKQAREVTR